MAETLKKEEETKLTNAKFKDNGSLVRHFNYEILLYFRTLVNTPLRITYQRPSERLPLWTGILLVELFMSWYVNRIPIVQAHPQFQPDGQHGFRSPNNDLIQQQFATNYDQIVSSNAFPHLFFLNFSV